MELRRDYGYSITETAAKVSLSPASVKRLLASAENKIVNNMKSDI